LKEEKESNKKIPHKYKLKYRKENMTGYTIIVDL
jgi:hypothetical protein